MDNQSNKFARQLTKDRAQAVAQMHGARMGRVKMEAFLSPFEQDYVDAVIESGRTAATTTHEVILAIIEGEHDVLYAV